MVLTVCLCTHVRVCKCAVCCVYLDGAWALTVVDMILTCCVLPVQWYGWCCLVLQVFRGST